jgi:uridine kinase
LRAGRPGGGTPSILRRVSVQMGHTRCRRRPQSAAPASVIILEGTHTARPELADLIDLAVLVTAGPSFCEPGAKLVRSRAFSRRGILAGTRPKRTTSLGSAHLRDSNLVVATG